MWKSIILLLIVAAGYFYYHWQFFHYMNRVFGTEHTKWKKIILAFIINYIWFIIASMLKLHLVINWALFFVFLLIEVWMIYQSGIEESMMMSLLGIIIGLSATLLMRGFFALILNRPIAMFDNRTGEAGNMKQYPVLCGFILAGIVINYYKKKKMDESISLIFSDESSMRFNIGMQIILYLYLTLNLLAYYVPGNGPALKVWEIKSAVFAVLGTNICSIYSVRMSRLNLYRKELQQEREKALADKKSDKQIWMLAFTDALTGCYNRYYLEEILQDYAENHIRYCLCFIDIDGLKTVNDELGHLEGDGYLKTVAEVLKSLMRSGQDMLFRYGGDEFVLLYREGIYKRAEERMKEAAEKLFSMSETKEHPFRMSMSYGIAENWEEDTMEALLELADKRMYSQKKEKGRQREGKI